MKTKRILCTSFALVLIFKIAAQDVIYKKSGEKISARMLNSTGQTISFHRYDPADSATYFISTSAIDSVIYQNGQKETYSNKNNLYKLRSSDPHLNHHLIGFDLAGVLYRNVAFSYEYLPGKTNFGFKASFSKNLKIVPFTESGYFWSSDPSNFNKVSWSSRLGVNYYIFPQQTFRLGTGIHYIFGSFSSAEGELILAGKNMQGMILNFFTFYNLLNNLAINLGTDVPLYINPSSLIEHNVVIRCELLFNF
jgi:hypothetical protein